MLRIRERCNTRNYILKCQRNPKIKSIKSDILRGNVK